MRVSGELAHEQRLRDFARADSGAGWWRISQLSNREDDGGATWRLMAELRRSRKLTRAKQEAIGLVGNMNDPRQPGRAPFFNKVGVRR